MEQTTRKLKIYSTGYSVYTPSAPGLNSVPVRSIPLIRLQGQWLRQLGFEEGGQVLIQLENEKLIITLDKES
jgi:Toxin SymE, type I toxin-antitoxin system